MGVDFQVSEERGTPEGREDPPAPLSDFDGAVAAAAAAAGVGRGCFVLSASLSKFASMASSIDCSEFHCYLFISSLSMLIFNLYNSILLNTCYIKPPHKMTFRNDNDWMLQFMKKVEKLTYVHKLHKFICTKLSI